ncbi:MAG TPA: hypothetical protein VHS78_01455 [Candidatus Elarobacter sp.]|jgi:hypothetical protein|nr:hypothetical protein [Candidatus Elarobacter sp.]
MMTQKRYALYALEALLGEPEDLTRERDGEIAPTRVAWTCGCTASGRSASALEITPCPAHEAVFES